MLEKLKNEVYKANMALPKLGLVTFTWGNVSGIDREKGLFVIKPSGIEYDQLKPSDMVVVNLDGEVVEGNLNPSSDTPTHAYLYQHFLNIGGITHTHSPWGVSFAAAKMDIPAVSTTHADTFYGDIPCAPALSEEEIKTAYELNTGKVIVSEFEHRGLDPDATRRLLPWSVNMAHLHGARPQRNPYTTLKCSKYRQKLVTMLCSQQDQKFMFRNTC